MKISSAKTKLTIIMLVLCLALSLLSVSALAAGVNYIDKIKVTYTHIDYKAGESPHATAEVTEGNCTVKYEYWRELYQKEEGGLWYGTGRYWYSDQTQTESLSADKRITKFESGHSYSYNIVLTADKGCYIGDEETVVTVGDYEWGTPARSTNLEIKNISTQLNVYGIYALDLPEDNTGGTIIDEKPDYKITEGVNSAWTKNTDGTLTFSANGDFSKFSGIKIDGSTVPADKYTAVSGSTVVTLKANYLSSISVGKHRLTVVYTDGECSTEFEIKAAQNGNARQNETKSPKTGDSALPVQWAMPLLIGCVLVSAVSVRKGKAFKN